MLHPTIKVSLCSLASRRQHKSFLIQSVFIRDLLQLYFCGINQLMEIKGKKKVIEGNFSEEIEL